MLFFLPPAVQTVIGAIALVIGLVFLHSVIMIGLGVLGLTVGATRWVRSRRANGFQS